MMYPCNAGIIVWLVCYRFGGGSFAGGVGVPITILLMGQVGGGAAGAGVGCCPHCFRETALERV